MSTRSYIAKQIGADQFQAIYCHCDGYLEHNGALLLSCYNEPEQVDALLALGDLAVLAEKLNPDPSRPHRFGFGQSQEGVTVAYGRDRGEKHTQARTMTLAQLDAPENWTEFVYVYTEEHQWKYFEGGASQEGLRDVAEELHQLEQQTLLGPGME